MSIACLFKKSDLYVKVLSEIESREKLQKFGVIIKAFFKNFQGTNLKIWGNWKVLYTLLGNIFLKEI